MDSHAFTGPSRRRALVAALVLAVGLLVPAVARAQLFRFDGSFGSALQPGGKFAGAQGLATDAAGRVYVADPTAGDVEIYDNAANGNRYLTTVGAGILRNPQDVAIDDRYHVYVTDVGRNTVSMF